MDIALSTNNKFLAYVLEDGEVKFMDFWNKTFLPSNKGKFSKLIAIY